MKLANSGHPVDQSTWQAFKDRAVTTGVWDGHRAEGRDLRPSREASKLPQGTGARLRQLLPQVLRLLLGRPHCRRRLKFSIALTVSAQKAETAPAVANIANPTLNILWCRLIEGGRMKC